MAKVSASTSGGTPVVPSLPKWNDAASVQSYITSLLSFVGAILALLHPGFREPAAVQAAVPSVAAVVAGVVQVVNILRHMSVTKAALENQR